VTTEAPKDYWDLLDSVQDSSDLPTWTGKQQKLTVWMAHGTGTSERAKATNDVVAAEIKRVTGIEIDIENSFDNGGNNLETKLSMLAAANDWPSMVYIDDSTSLKQLAQNDKLYDLSSMMPQYAPHITGIFMEQKDGKLVGKSQMITDRVTAMASDKAYFLPMQANWVLTYNIASARPDLDPARWSNIQLPESQTQLCQIGRGHIAAVRHDTGDRSCVPDVRERIPGEQHEIRHAPDFHRAVVAPRVPEERRVDRRRLQRLERREPGRDETLELEMQAESGQHVHACGRVRPGEKRHFRRVQLANDVQLVRDERRASRQRVARETLADRRACLRP
jgi:hypothetical protein